ncbi:NAD(P)-dependent oxidoreductase [Sphingobium sp. EM0848]|uniref:NAD-dependent epimerase/dehydratase family protein n=1 Tax=Sphingobium sp. EM0848 TaxID=2743473 RepID=UPI00159C9805|nr:NAD(P)-dependent oxidoreductase [Sphingobium sp. EM0848]
MKIIVVGGAGMIGGHAALHLKSKGHDVSIAGRTPPAAGTPLGDLPFLQIDYINNTSFPAGFDALVFCAGQDVRHIPEGEDSETYWKKVNSVAVPRFFQLAKDAGVKVAINVGSFYPQAAPHLVAGNRYVESRKDSDDGVRALNGPGFKAISVNAPFVLGAVPGLVVPMFAAYTQYAEGKFAPMPDFAPGGGVNFISTQSLAEAVEGAIERGEGGKAYLVGDENLSYQQYFGMFFEAAGRPVPPVLDQEHPMMPDAAIFAGRGNNLFYEPDASETALLGYRRNDVRRMVNEIVAQYRSA